MGSAHAAPLPQSLPRASPNFFSEHPDPTDCPTCQAHVESVELVMKLGSARSRDFPDVGGPDLVARPHGSLNGTARPLCTTGSEAFHTRTPDDRARRAAAVPGEQTQLIPCYALGAISMQLTPEQRREAIRTIREVHPVAMNRDGLKMSDTARRPAQQADSSGRLVVFPQA